VGIVQVWHDQKCVEDYVPASCAKSEGIRVKPWIALLFTTAASLANRGTGQYIPPQGNAIRVPVLPGTDIRFRKLSNPQNLSQVRVHSIVEDGQGFLWFGTWNGLNRYDGYKLKVFKHETGNKTSLSGTHVYSLFRDRAGNLWVGTDQFLDRFDPLTETFQHYRLGPSGDQTDSSIVTHISQDSSGFLWLSTQNGLFRLDPQTGKTTNHRHTANDPSSLGDNDIKSTGEDRSGSFWVGTSKTLDEFDRQTGRVKRHINTGESGIGLWFHEDRAHSFWVIYGSSGRIATLDRNSGTLTPYEYDHSAVSQPNQAYAMLEDRDGTMWFGTAGAGLMRFDRASNRFISYEHDPGDRDSIGENRVIALFEDHESNIWIGLHQAEPNFFRKKPLPFENLTRKSSCKSEEISGLVSTIYQDSLSYLWLGANRRLYRINRETGECSPLKEADNSEVLSIVEDGHHALWLGNAAPGLLKYDLRTGRRIGYTHDSADPTTLCSGVIEGPGKN
jgi:ligand-binding sensor domain-containing protein